MNRSYSRLFRPRQQEPYEEGWLITYADMITLLLGVFIIMLSISEPKKEKLKEFEQRLQEEFGMLNLPIDTAPKEFKAFVNELKGIAKDSAQWRDIFVVETAAGLEIEMRSTPFFEKGSAELNEEGQWVLGQLMDRLKEYNLTHYFITVEGHTDNVPIKTHMFPSNWDLSASRAATVVRFLSSVGISEKQLRAIGYGETQPKFPNTDDKGQPIPDYQAKNRRVVIKIERQ